MTDNPFEQWIKVVQDMAKNTNSEPGTFVPKGFEDMFPTMPANLMEAFMGKGVSPEGLDAKTKLLLTLHGLTIAGAVAEPQIKLTVRHAVEAGATKQEIAETIAQAAMFGGVPAMTKAMEMATEVLDKDQSA